MCIYEFNFVYLVPNIFLQKIDFNIDLFRTYSECESRLKIRGHTTFLARGNIIIEVL